MKPSYEVKAWQEDDWWLARVVGASDGADPAPLNALTQARTLAKVEPMARDLVATILDADETAFSVTVDYVVPEDVQAVLSEAGTVRSWLDAAQVLWQKTATEAASTLTASGYSLRETAVLLKMSHQRVAQLLEASPAEERLAQELKKHRPPHPAVPKGTVDVIFVVRDTTDPSGAEHPAVVTDMDPHLREQVGAMLSSLTPEARDDRSASPTAPAAIRFATVVLQT